eukprot:2681012-Alexandrium_andersonii.AAC.1
MRFALWSGFIKWATGTHSTINMPTAKGLFAKLSPVVELTKQLKVALRNDKAGQIRALTKEAQQAAEKHDTRT